MNNALRVTRLGRNRYAAIEIETATLQTGQVMAWNGDQWTNTAAPGGSGPHTHPQGDITDLVSDLAAKAPSAHAHAQGDVTGLTAALAGKANTAHTHPSGEVSGLGPLATLTLPGGTSNFLRADGQFAAPPGGASLALQQFALVSAYPFGGAAATLTATTHGATTARVFPFSLPGSLNVARVVIRTNAVLANCLQLGVFDAAGARLWTSGVLSTVATGWVAVSANLPVSLPAGDYYFATTNNNVVSTTAAYAVTPAVGTAGLPRWGTVPATLGAMPASINPAAITETVGGWMAYVLLSSVAT